MDTSLPMIRLRFHAYMLACVAILWCASLSMQPDGWTNLIALMLVFPTLLLPGAIWDAKGHPERRDAALVLPWIGTLWLTMRWLAPAFAASPYPLRDASLTGIDRAIGVSVPAIEAWISTKPLLLRSSDLAYASLSWFLLSAAVIPALLGKRRGAETFAVANATAFVISLPMLLLLPAIGPWMAHGFVPNAAQLATEASVITSRAGAHGAREGTICLPSFHTIWAMLSAAAFWDFRRLRVPAAALAALIILSTITTGWHYAIDVIAGLAVGAASLALAAPVSQWYGSAAYAAEREIHAGAAETA